MRLELCCPTQATVPLPPVVKRETEQETAFFYYYHLKCLDIDCTRVLSTQLLLEVRPLEPHSQCLLISKPSLRHQTKSQLFPNIQTTLAKLYIILYLTGNCLLDIINSSAARRVSSPGIIWVTDK